MKEAARLATNLPRAALPAAWGITLWVLVCVGGLTVVAGMALEPARAGANFLLALFFLLGLGLAALVFISLQVVSNASWAVIFRRVPEAMTAALPVTLLLSLGLFAMIPVLYEWSHSEAVAQDAILAGKSQWLNTPFFVGRTVVCGVLWLFFSYCIVGWSRRQDTSQEPRDRRFTVALSGIFIALFAVSFSVICFDWLMSVEPHWFSTAFAVYNFSGLFLSGLAAITLLVILLRKMGPLREVVTEDHLHDLGKLILGFSVFWAYIWFCQYMLIWYTNMPEETSYFHLRQSGTWGLLFVLNLFVNWIIPFLILLPRPAKRNENVLLNVCVLLIFGRWLDLYLMVLPPLVGKEPTFGILEIAPFVGVAALFLLVFFRSLGRSNIIPLNDPFLEESLHHHQ